MTIRQLLENYKYNTYSDPLKAWDDEAGLYHGWIPFKINGIYFYAKINDDELDVSEIPDNIQDLELVSWSIQSNYALSIFTE